MKKIYKLMLAAASAAGLLVSCNVLETSSPSAFDDANVFSSYDLAEKTIFGITETFCEVNSYRGRFLPWYGYNTDIEWYNTYKPGDGKSDIAGYDCKVNNAQLNTNNNPYVLMYTGIERANLCIEGLEKYADLKNDKMKYLLGEALTLRAMIYYDLVKAWGDVPARFESITSETIYVKKSSRDVIYKQILSDLEEAMSYVPYPGETDATKRTDRINKTFVSGLYARIALAASGYALRPDDGRVGTGDAGTIRKTNDPDLQASVLYPKALKYLEEAINANKSSLEKDYEGMWKNLNNMNNLTAGPGYETLYVIPFGNGRGRWNFTFAVNSAGATINGYTVNRGGDAGPVPTVYFMYDNDDVRRDVTCVNYSWLKDNSIEPSGISKWYFGKYRFEWMDANPYTGGNDDGVKPVVMRYADVLLMAAEIENELNGPTEKAKGWLKQVRERAFKGHESDADSYVDALSGKEAFFNAIVDERALEFCGEFLRKGDLIRWNMLKSKMDVAVNEMKSLRAMEGKYSYLQQSAGQIWYKAETESISIWGLAEGQQSNPGADWEPVEGYVTKFDDEKATGFYTKRIEGIYYNDPDTRQYWPIFQDTITNSQGNLVNDYGY